MLCRIEYQDLERDSHVRVHSNHYAADSRGGLHLLSVGGENMAVRAVLAALASQQRQSVRVEDGPHSWLTFPHFARVKFKTARLPSGLTHGIIWRHDDMSGLLVTDPSPRRVYDVLYVRYPVTMIPEWADWLAQQLRDDDSLKELTCHGMKAATVRTSTSHLDRLIQDGVKSGSITI